MAEFVEVIKQARRMCRSNSCDSCTLPELYEGMCVWDSTPSEFTDEIIAKIESKTLQWAAEHPEPPEPPEPQYPTWAEWQKENFPNSNLPIPAEIAEKLGIKLKEA